MTPSPPPAPKQTDTEQLECKQTIPLQVVDQAIQASFSGSGSSDESSRGRHKSVGSLSASSSTSCDAQNCACACAYCAQHSTAASTTATGLMGALDMSHVDNSAPQSTGYNQEQRPSTSIATSYRERTDRLLRQNQSIDDLLAGSYVHQAPDGSRIVVSRGWPARGAGRAAKSGSIQRQRGGSRSKLEVSTGLLNKHRVRRRSELELTRKFGAANKLCSSLVSAHRPGNLSSREKQRLLVEFLTRLPNETGLGAGQPRGLPAAAIEANDQLERKLDYEAANAGAQIKYIRRRNPSLSRTKVNNNTQEENDRGAGEQATKVAKMPNTFERRKSRPIIVELSSPARASGQK